MIVASNVSLPQQHCKTQNFFCWKWQVSCSNEYSLCVLCFIACREYGMSNCIYCK